MNREKRLIYSSEYMDFYRKSNRRTQEKLLYATSILETFTPVPSKFVKKLVGTDFYEMRISVDTEIRVILFSIDNDNINEAKSVVFLNGFIKKSTKDYEKAIAEGLKILRRLL